MGGRSVSCRGPGTPCKVVRRDRGPQTQVHKNYLRKYIYVLILNPPCGPPTPLAHTRGMRSLQRRVEPQPGTGRPKLPSGQDRDLLQRAVLPPHRAVARQAEESARGQEKTPTARRGASARALRRPHPQPPGPRRAAPGATRPRGGGFPSVCPAIGSVLARTYMSSRPFKAEETEVPRG